MGSKRTKIFVLAALTIVLIYLWAGNLSLFTTTESRDIREMKLAESTTADTVDRIPIEYQPVKLNPFKRSDVVSFPAVNPGPPRNVVKPPPDKLGGRLTLAGFVAGAPRIQVVIQDQAGATFTKTLGDTVFGWKLFSVTSTMAIFSMGKQRDTLFLKK